MATYYWDLELFELIDGEKEILDHSDMDKLSRHVLNDWRVLPNVDLVLVRDSAEGRAWAYVDKNEKLPLAFVDAYGKKVAKVPLRFHRELQRAGDIGF